jgi:hypothetical protein
VTPLTQNEKKKKEKKEKKGERGTIQKIEMFILKQEQIVNSASIFMCRMANRTTTYATKITRTSLVF